MTCLCCSTGIDNSPKPLHNRLLTALIEITPLKTIIFLVCPYFFQSATRFWSRTTLLWTQLSILNQDCESFGRHQQRLQDDIGPELCLCQSRRQRPTCPPFSHISLTATQAHPKVDNLASQSTRRSPLPPPENTSTGEGSAGKGPQTLKSWLLDQEWLWERSAGGAVIAATESYTHILNNWHTQIDHKTLLRAGICLECVADLHFMWSDGTLLVWEMVHQLHKVKVWPYTSAAARVFLFGLRFCFCCCCFPLMTVTIAAFMCSRRKGNWNWKQEARVPLEKTFHGSSLMINFTSVSTLFFHKRYLLIFHTFLNW